MKGKTTKYIFPPLIITSVLALGSCDLKGRVNFDPVSKEFYETARLIMTNQEKDIFNYLPDQESREEFIEDFWSKRDPNPDTEENEFKEEFFRRIDYANRRFREGIPGWKTDRGRIYIYLGPPDKIEQRPYINDPSIKGLIWWAYYRYRLGIEFIDRTGEGRYLLSRQTGAAGGLLEVIERAKFGQIYGSEGDFDKIFSDFDVRYSNKTQEIFVLLPVESFSFKAEDRLLKADFEFEFFIYERKGPKKDRFRSEKSFEMAEEELVDLEKISFAFPYDLKSGEYYFDVMVFVKAEGQKVRKIFKIKF